MGRPISKQKGERGGEKMQEIGAIRSTDKLDLLYSRSNKHFHASSNQFLRLCSKNLHHAISRIAEQPHNYKEAKSFGGNLLSFNLTIMEN